MFVRRVRQTRSKRADVCSEKKIGSGVKSEARNKILIEVDITAFNHGCHLMLIKSTDL